MKYIFHMLYLRKHNNKLYLGILVSSYLVFKNIFSDASIIFNHCWDNRIFKILKKTCLVCVKKLFFNVAKKMLKI